MKRLIYAVILAFVVASCASAERARSVSVGFADYRPYTTAGMFISPDAYTGGSFTSIGELVLDIHPAWKFTADKGIVNEELSIDDILKRFVEEARKRGANGIVNFKTEVVRTAVQKTASTPVESYRASALLILIHEPNDNN